MRDLWHSIRGLRRERGALLFAAVVVALGAAAAATIFSTAEATLHPAIPYPDPERLVVLADVNPAKTPRPEPLPPARYRFFQGSTELFTQLGAYDTLEQNLTGLGAALRAQTARVAPELLALSGLTPVQGRLLTTADVTSAATVALVSEALWRERLGSGALNDRTLQLDGQAVQVVGVLPSAYDLPRADVYVPLRMVPTSRVARHLRVVGRLATGISLEQARARMETLSDTAERSHPETDAGWRTIVMPLRDHRVAELRAAVRVLIGAGVLLALIACASVGNLLAVRYVARGQEIAVRVAIGAGRLAIVRLLAIEGLLVGAAGALAGWWLGSALLPLVSGIEHTGLALTPPSGAAAFVAAWAIALVAAQCPSRCSCTATSRAAS